MQAGLGLVKEELLDSDGNTITVYRKQTNKQKPLIY